MNALDKNPHQIIRLTEFTARLGSGVSADGRRRGAGFVEAGKPAAISPRRASRSARLLPDAREGRTTAEVDVVRIERAVREMLLAIGEDPERDGLRETPRRVAKVYRKLFAGLRQDPAVHLSRADEQETEDLVAVRNIEFFSVCERHLLPFFGLAHIAYRPSGNRVVGLSKLARAVEGFARRPQVQERLTGQIADAVAEHLGAAGVAVVCEARQTCTAMRGGGEAGSIVTTAAFRGVFEDDHVEREHAVYLLGVGPSGGSGCVQRRISMCRCDGELTRSPGGM